MIRTEGIKHLSSGNVCWTVVHCNGEWFSLSIVLLLGLTLIWRHGPRFRFVWTTGKVKLPLYTVSFADLDGHCNTGQLYIECGNDVPSPLLGDKTRTCICDNYNIDKYSHGGPHIDRVDKNGKLIGRYNEDGTGIPHKGMEPPKIPNSDKDEFAEAAGKLKDLKERLAKAAEEAEKKKDDKPDKSPAKSTKLRDRLCACNDVMLPMQLPGGGLLPSPQVAIPQLQLPNFTLLEPAPI